MLVFLFFSLLIIFPVRAQNTGLDSIIAAHQAPGISIGAQVNEVRTKKNLFSSNGKKTFNPASAMKVVTSAAALLALGGEFQYKTEFATDSLSHGVIGNLYVKGSGDPSMVEERLWRIAKDLKVRGVKKITGDIVIDNSLFDSFAFAGQQNGSSRAYNASISPFAVNFNSFAVVARNYGDGIVEVSVDPPTHYFELESAVKPAGNFISVSRTFRGGKEYIKASGGVSQETVKYANVADPLEYAGATLSWVLGQMGIEFTGKIRNGAFAGTKKLVTDRSRPLSLILRDLNKFSNNFTAEMILKTLAAQKSGPPGTTEKGAALLVQYVSSLGVAPDEYAIFNGSGLSRNNRLSPNALNRVLLDLYDHKKTRHDFMASLAIAGVDGTLKNRLRSADLAGNVKAKTGTLNDVSALSGFMETASGRQVAFSILVNGAGAASARYHQMQEKILLNVYRGF